MEVPQKNLPKRKAQFSASGKFFGGSITVAQIVGEKSAHQMAFGTVPGGPLQPYSRAQNLGKLSVARPRDLSKIALGLF